MGRAKAKESFRLNVVFTIDSFVIEEDMAPVEEKINRLIRDFEDDRYHALYLLGFEGKEEWFSPSLEYIHSISELLIKALSQQSDIELSRDEVEVCLSSDEVEMLYDERPFALGTEYISKAWILKLWEHLLQEFREEIKSFDGTVGRYFLEHQENINPVGRVFFHLVENMDPDFPFAFMATYTTKPIKSKKAVHTPLKNALKEFDGDEKMLLALISTVFKAAEKSRFMASLMETGELFSPLKLKADEAYTFLQELQIYEEAGIMCRVPDWWKRKKNTIGLSITVGDKEPSKVGLDAIIDFTPVLNIGGEKISEKELKAFLKMAEGLISYKGKWVEVDKKKIEAILTAFEKVRESKDLKNLSMVDALRMELSVREQLGIKEEVAEISMSQGQWLRAVKDKLMNPKEIENIEIMPTLQAELRGYQKEGYHWLHKMSTLGFGACLADDMGLGKTVQIIAFLEYMRGHGGGSVLLVLPASLIGNWQNEIRKFAPLMPVQILHKSEVKSTDSLILEEGKFLYITTYGMASKMEELKEMNWNLLILDEAQAIKNPGTKQSKAVKAIPARMKIALTGTPIENHLGDLWSLFDFLNQGLLGTAKEFTDYARELGENPEGYGKLRKMIQPFMLRRLKTDKSIISDLPEKIEINEYTTLSKKQIGLYKQLLLDIERKLSTSEGIERKGLVLASLMKFKQICNHPDQYLGREEFKAEHSGKFEQLKEICEIIKEKRERVIVFTQFREMTEPLKGFLGEVFGREGFVLHGGTPVKERREIVERFNGEKYIPFMVLSLKAGGVGLNLTSANHVVHFDRWWNPAVENQATDRAFRIGQTKNVMVHKFVTQGTIEEKIDKLISDKQALSADILSATGEKWITEYDNNELMKIFSLGGERS